MEQDKQKRRKTVNQEIKNKKKKKSKLIWILLIITIFIIYEVYSMAMYTLGKKQFEDMFMYKHLYNFIDANTPKNTEEEYSLNVLALGDIVPSSALFNSVDDNSFESQFKDTKEVISKYDIRLANLNIPISTSTRTSYNSKYSSPVEVLDFVKYLNIDYLSVASENIVEENELNISETKSILNNKQVSYTGLNNKPLIIEKNNIKIGVLSYCTELEDNINFLTEDRLTKDIKYLNDNTVDYILAYLSIPNENNLIISKDQKEYVNLLTDNGVHIVLGVGSKLIQEDYKDYITLEDGSNTEIYAIYSMGDLLGNISTEEELTSVGIDFIFNKKIVKDPDGNIIDEKVKTSYKVNDIITLYNDYERYNFKGNYILDENEDFNEIEVKIYERLN